MPLSVGIISRNLPYTCEFERWKFSSSRLLNPAKQAVTAERCRQGAVPHQVPEHAGGMTRPSAVTLAAACCALLCCAAQAQAGRRLHEEEPYRDLEPEFDTCNGALRARASAGASPARAGRPARPAAPAGVKYEEQGWYQLEVPTHKRAPVAALQEVAALAPLLNASAPEVGRLPHRAPAPSRRLHRRPAGPLCSRG